VVAVYDGATVAVVVPAYNEQGHVGAVIETMPAYVDRVYVVEDGSTDDTWTEIQAVTEQENDRFRESDERYTGLFDRRVVPIRHERNRGVGGAIKTGYLAARRDGFDVTAVMGADGQMEPEHLADIVAPIATGHADYAKGNRLIESAHHEDMPTVRYVGNWLLTLLTKIASGYWSIGDPQNGYTAISLEALHAIDLEEMYEYYGYCNDLLVRLNVAEMTVVDVPRPTTYADEDSHIEYAEYIPKVSAMLARNFLWRLRAKYLDGVPHPIPLLYGLGALLSMASVTSALTSGDVTTFGLGLVAGTVPVLGAMAWDRAHERSLDGRVSGEPDAEHGAPPAPERVPTD